MRAAGDKGRVSISKSNHIVAGSKLPDASFLGCALNVIFYCKATGMHKTMYEAT
jgi:hypothetical protein